MWLVIEHNAKLAGHKAWALGRVRAKVAEPFKSPGKDGRWLWRLVGDKRQWSEQDYAELFHGDSVARRAAGNALDKLDMTTHMDLSLRSSGINFDPDADGDDDEDDDDDE